MHTYIIGEIGQNHNGSVDIAKLLVDLVARPIREELFELDLASVDAIKLTKRDLNQELTDSEMTRPYHSPHSFGDTYGDHRRYLELTDEEHHQVYLHAKSKGLQFVETICNPGALSILRLFQPDHIKIASRDLTNLPLLAAVAETELPVILSTGMHDRAALDEALSILVERARSIAILHCVSEYPTNPANANLLTIPFLLQHYPEFIVGYSDHTVGISASIAAVALGAKMIEKHVTIDRRMKGTDQAGSLGPDGVYRMTRDIRLTELSLGTEQMVVAPGAESARLKLERSIASTRAIKRGAKITEDDMFLLSPGTGLRWSERNRILGRIAARDIPARELLLENMLE